MNEFKKNLRKKSCLLLIFISSTFLAKAQLILQPYNYLFYQKLNDSVYSTNTRLHTASKPYFQNDSSLQKKYEEIITSGDHFPDKKSSVYSKLFRYHQIDVQKTNFNLFADFLPEIGGGREFNNSRTISNGSAGFQLGGSVGQKFHFYTSGFASQAIFPSYYNTYVNQVGIVNGQANNTNGLNDRKQWSYLTALVSYTPIKYLNITAGHDKNFIGDGYRSMLLSDYSAPYDFIKLNGTLGDVSLTALYAYMNDPRAIRTSNLSGDRKKWGVFHYLDWNITNNLSIGVFDAVIWAASDDMGHDRGFDYTYASPLIFLRPIEASNGSPDNALVGANGKYKISDYLTVYGQFSLDEFESKNFFAGEGSSRNKYGWQIGLRGTNVLSIPNLNYLIEYNEARPYTYSEQKLNNNYTQQNEPLAHPFGANFREVVTLINYRINRFEFMAELDYGHYGLDTQNMNYGKDPFLSYLTPAKFNGNYIGQGLTTNMYYGEGRASYIINPQYNLRIELTTVYRKERNAVFSDQTSLLTIGIRSSFRSLYHDISSYKIH